MQQNKKPRNKEKIFIYISVVLIISIIALGGVYVFSSLQNPNTGPTLATEYVNVTASKAYEIVTDSNIFEDNGKNLTIIDARRFDYSCDCQLDPAYRDGHLPGAILDKRPLVENYYNKTTDILVYTENGENLEAQVFCKNLIGHIYGDIYLLEGGYTSWEQFGYKIETGDPQ